MAELDDVKREVVIASRMLYEMGLADGLTIEQGHASMRPILRPPPAASG